MRGRCGLVGVAALLAGLASCDSDEGDHATSGASAILSNDTITIGSFDFAESEILAQAYGQALAAKGFAVDVQTSVGPRELVLPALIAGLVEVVPEYGGTSLAFVSGGEFESSADPTPSIRRRRKTPTPWWSPGRPVTAFGVVVVFMHASSRRLIAIGAAAAFAGSIAISRTVLGAHWLSDVVAGACIGTGWSLVWAAGLEIARSRRQERSAVDQRYDDAWMS